jgi:hypothetical protein
MRVLLCCIVMTILSAACANQRSVDQPAVIVGGTPETQAEVQRVVAAALKTESVLLSEDVFVRESVLVIEPKRIRDGSGVRQQGRETRLPNHFALLKSGDQCVLLHKETQQRYLLFGIQCRPNSVP